MAGHGGATAAGGDNGIDLAGAHQRVEDVEKAHRQLPCLVAITGSKGRLTTTGLSWWKNDLHPQTLQQFHRRHTDSGVDHVHHTGDKEGNAPWGAGKLFFLHIRATIIIPS